MKYHLFFLLILILSLLAGCYSSYPSENYPDHYLKLCSIKADSTGYTELFEIENCSEHVDFFRNYTISNDNSFAIFNYGIHGLVKYDLETGEKIQLTDDMWIRNSPIDISSDNILITFASEGDIFVINSDGSDLVNLTNSPEDYDSYPTFSKSSSSILFSSEIDYQLHDSLSALQSVGLLNRNITQILLMENNGYKITSSVQTTDPEIYFFNYTLRNGNSGSISGLWKYFDGISELFFDCYPERDITLTYEEDLISVMSDNEGFVLDLEGNIVFSSDSVVYRIDGICLSPQSDFVTFFRNRNLHIYDLEAMNTQHIIDGFLPFMTNERIYYFISDYYYYYH